MDEKTMKKKYGKTMKYGEAIAILSDLKKYEDEEIMEAISVVLEMTTIMAVKKEMLLGAIAWMYKKMTNAGVYEDPWKIVDEVEYQKAPLFREYCKEHGLNIGDHYNEKEYSEWFDKLSLEYRKQIIRKSREEKLKGELTIEQAVNIILLQEEANEDLRCELAIAQGQSDISTRTGDTNE